MVLVYIDEDDEIICYFLINKEIEGKGLIVFVKLVEILSVELVQEVLDRYWVFIVSWYNSEKGLMVS